MDISSVILSMVLQTLWSSGSLSSIMTIVKIIINPLCVSGSRVSVTVCHSTCNRKRGSPLGNVCPPPPPRDKKGGGEAPTSVTQVSPLAEGFRCLRRLKGLRGRTRILEGIRFFCLRENKRILIKEEKSSWIMLKTPKSRRKENDGNDGRNGIVFTEGVPCSSLIDRFIPRINTHTGR